MKAITVLAVMLCLGCATKPAPGPMPTMAEIGFSDYAIEDTAKVTP